MSAPLLRHRRTPALQCIMHTCKLMMSCMTNQESHGRRRTVCGDSVFRPSPLPSPLLRHRRIPALGRFCTGKGMVHMRLLSPVMAAAVNVACIVHACFSPRPACSKYTHCGQCLGWLHLKCLGIKWFTKRVFQCLETMAGCALKGQASP